VTDEEDVANVCARCGEEYSLTEPGLEPTKYCNECAHVVVAELESKCEPEPGQTIWDGTCPVCGASLDVHHGEEPGEIGIVYSPKQRAGRQQ
jgi:DNA-directed RNA polymerase subunit M/transcription elongation factor TFIIS